MATLTQMKEDVAIIKGDLTNVLHQRAEPVNVDDDVDEQATKIAQVCVQASSLSKKHLIRLPYLIRKFQRILLSLGLGGNAQTN